MFEVFDINLLKGDKENSLKGPNKTVISTRAAKKYFGAEDPMGKTISWDGDRKFEVTGIFENLPDNSHIKFDFMFSYETLNQETKNESETNWGWYDFNTYVLLQPGTDAKALQTKWDEWLLKDRGEEWKKRNAKQEFILEPLLDIHLYANLLQESPPEERGDGDSVYALSIIALFILIIAWVNYINLATAKSFERANEVGIRKVMGAQKNQLMNYRSFLFDANSILQNDTGVWFVLPDTNFSTSYVGTGLYQFPSGVFPYFPLIDMFLVVGNDTLFDFDQIESKISIDSINNVNHILKYATFSSTLFNSASADTFKITNGVVRNSSYVIQ